ncbi:MFS transporter [Heyndrickxia oleronia]|uniref:MFS transporter n=1 Tax=Heyndrickxia TaxID=2837504 RepID=UPI00090342C7|nr:MFS transporter [Heyndrickxia oleronia]MCM3455917.1 MFS transporter [Heyndrickxia oleronia]OJH18211.1 MFS transporter [Bacillus obstructivus]
MKWANRWKQQWGGYNSNIRNAIYGNVFTQIGLGVFMVIYNFYIRELGFPDQMNGQVISMTSLATAIILIPAGILSDRLGRKRVIIYGLIFTGVTLFLRSIIEPRTLLLMAAFLTGLTQAFIQVSSVPLLAENSTAEQRVKLFSLHFGLMTAANVIGNIFGGVLSDLLEWIYSPIISIRITLIIGAVIFLIGILPIMRLKEMKTDVNNDKNNNKRFISFKEQKESLKLIIFFAIAQLLIGFGAGLVIPYLNLYFADRFNASNTTIGFIISMGQAATAIAMFIGPFVVSKVGEVKAVVFLQLASLPFLLLTGFTHSLLLAAIGFLFRQALMNAGNPIQMSLMMSKVDNSVKGLANSVNQMVFNLGWALMGPVSMGIVSRNGSYNGYAIVFSITCFLYLVGSIYFFIVFKSFGSKKDHPPISKVV